jgi:hypothetical protein
MSSNGENGGAKKRKLPDWLYSRTLVLGTAAGLLVVAAVVIFVFAFTPESTTGQGSEDPTGPGGTVVLSVEQALAAEQGQDVNVQGSVLATGENTVLASALAESMPPQAGGAILTVQGLDLETLVGLSTSAGQAGLAEVTWSDYPVVLGGVVNNGVLTVKRTPGVEEDTSVEGLRLRFSPVTEPITSGDQAWWAFDVTNTGQAPVRLVFLDGQRGDVILSQDGTDEYTWSEGKAFTQALEVVMLQPGKSLSIVLNDPLNVPAGTYALIARVTAMVGPEGQEVPLPDISSSLTVY